MTVDELLDGLAERLRCIDGLTVSTDPAATILVPMATVTDDEIVYHDTMAPRNLYNVNTVVTIYVSLADNPEGKLEARRYRSNSGSMSVAGSLETTLGTDDPMNDVPSIVCTSSTVGVTTSPSGETYNAVRFDVTAHIPGES